MNRPFSGIIPPLITPLCDRDRLDDAGLARLIEHLIAGGVRGIFALGTTGEAPSLGHRLRREMVVQTARRIAGRAPLLVGITDTAFVESIELAQVASDAGADAAVLSTPYYFAAEQDELAAYVENVARAIPLPIMLYNIPSRTRLRFEIETLERLAQTRRIVGIKDSSGDLDYFARLVQLRSRRPDWSILIGPEHLLPEAMQLGGDGGVTGGANLLPRPFVACYEAACAGDAAGLEAARRAIDALQQLYEIDRSGARHIKPVKCGLSLLGICDDFMAEPFQRFAMPKRERVRQCLDAIPPSFKPPPQTCRL